MAATSLINPATHVGGAINLILNFLEKISEENLWKSILGERLVNLGQKYFGNDFVTLSLAFYLAPILKTHWFNLVSLIYNKVSNANTVSITIFAHNYLYNHISKYVFENGPSRGKMISGVAECSSTTTGNYTITDFYKDDKALDNYERDEHGPKEADGFYEEDISKVQLLPPPNFTETINYKGHTITVDFVEGTTEVSEHLVVSMKAPNTKLLHVIIEEWSNRNNAEQVARSIYRASFGSWQYERDLPRRPFDSVHLREGLKEYLIQDIKTFRKKADWYHKRGIAHRRGYLLYGPPGTGKSSTIQALATILELNIAFTSLSNIESNDALTGLLRNLPSNCAMVLEDVDHLFKTSKPDAEKSPSALTMSGLLNVLDGMQGNEGSLIFMTCNSIDKIEPALLRPGRIDVKLKLDYAAVEQIRGTFWRFMNLDDDTSLPLEAEERVEVENLADKFVDMIPVNRITTAELQSFFIDLLLDANSSSWTRKDVYNKMFSRIPGFLEKVELDRTQAKNHRAEKEKKDDSQHTL